MESFWVVVKVQGALREHRILKEVAAGPHGRPPLRRCWTDHQLGLHKTKPDRQSTFHDVPFH